MSEALNQPACFSRFEQECPLEALSNRMKKKKRDLGKDRQDSTCRLSWQPTINFTWSSSERRFEAVFTV